MTQPTNRQPTAEWPPPAELDPEPGPDASTAEWLAWRFREMRRIPRAELI